MRWGVELFGAIFSFYDKNPPVSLLWSACHNLQEIVARRVWIRLTPLDRAISKVIYERISIRIFGNTDNHAVFGFPRL